MENLIFGVSGVRGIVNETLTENVAEKLGIAFATFCANKNATTIAIGKDLRESGSLLKDAFIKGAINYGLNVIDLGDCATPTALLNIRDLEISGGAVITASHNPKEWNGIKFVSQEGTFLTETAMETLYKIYKSIKIANNGQWTMDNGQWTMDNGRCTMDNEAINRHKKAVLNTVNVQLIQSKHYKIVLDSANGVLGKEGKEFLEDLGCDVIEETSERGLEPIPQHLSNLSNKVKNSKADIGFAVDPDGDRLSIVTELGTPLGEEYTLPLVCSFVLKSRLGSLSRIIVTNLSTSGMIEDVASQNKCIVIRTKVGEINVVQKMKEVNATFGGEGNGGVIDPLVHYTRDAIVGMGRILEYMALSNKKISELADTLPKYFIRKDKVKYRKNFDCNVEARHAVPLPKWIQFGKINYEDGIRINFTARGKEGWLHLRKSNTEPILRIICEAKEETLVNSLIEEVKKCVE